MFGQALHLAAGDLNADFDAVRPFFDFHIKDIVWRCDDALGEAKAQGKVIEIGGRGEHHRMRHTVIDQCNRGLAGERVYLHGRY